jgi:hypothetical protein
LKSLARKKTPAGKIAKSLKRTEGATRQKAFSIGFGYGDINALALVQVGSLVIQIIMISARKYPARKYPQNKILLDFPMR